MMRVIGRPGGRDRLADWPCLTPAGSCGTVARHEDRQAELPREPVRFLQCKDVTLVEESPTSELRMTAAH